LCGKGLVGTGVVKGVVGGGTTVPKPIQPAKDEEGNAETKTLNQDKIKITIRK
jgi:hypothetical protein